MIGLRQAGVLLAVCSGLFALLLIGGPLGPLGLFAMAVVFAAPRLRPWLARTPWALVTGGVLLGALAWVVSGGHPDVALGVALVYLQLHRQLSRSSATDDRIALLLAGLMLVAAASRTEASLWMLGLAGWTVGLVFGLLPTVGRKTSRPVQGMVVGLLGTVIAMTLVLFPLIPRRASPISDETHGAMTGFSTEMKLGQFEDLLSDPTVVFRVRASVPVSEVLYFRGVALEHFDGKRWWTDAKSVTAVQQAPESFPSDAVTFDIIGAPDEAGTVFTTGQALWVSAGATGLSRDAHGAWRLVDAADEVTVTVVSRGPWGRHGQISTEAPRAGQYLELPHDMDARIDALAHQIVPTDQGVDQTIARISDYLRETYTYTRSPRDRGVHEPLVAFLFERQTGHCEYFASSQAILLRTMGIPSRIVNGFVGGEVDPIGGDLVFRRHHAHSWVEAWNGSSWRIVDATPGPGAPQGPALWAGLGERAQNLWLDYVIGFDGRHQQQVLAGVGSSAQRLAGRSQPTEIPWLGLAVVLALSALFALVVERLLKISWRRLAGEPVQTLGPVSRWHRKASDHLAQRADPPPVCLPPLEAAEWWVARNGEQAKPLVDLVWLMYRVRYGGESATDLAPEAQRLAAVVMRDPAESGRA